MKKLNSIVIVKTLDGKVIKKLDIRTSNYNIRDSYTIIDNRYNAYMNRYYRMYNLG